MARVQVTSTRAVVDAATRRGLAPAERAALLARHDLTEVTLADPDARIPAETALAAWDEAAAAVDAPELAVWAALELPFGAYRVIDHLCAHVATFGDAVTALVRMFRMVNDEARLTLALAPDAHPAATLGFVLADGRPVPGRYVDYTFSAAVDRINRVVARPVRPSVRLRRPPPRDPAPHHRAFGPDVAFDQPADEVRFTVADWATPTRNPDDTLRPVLERHSELLLAELPSVGPWIDQVRAAIEAGLPHGRADLVRVSAALGLSTRTLQRRLDGLGQSWTDLLEDTRRALACVYLRDPALGLDEIAALLDYADASTFHRAFVRWTGETPGRWRRTR
ncbi:MAG: AraC family transcriptional regulator ligand-binding domain-containing protein [Myxococcota bacterium]